MCPNGQTQKPDVCIIGLGGMATLLAVVLANGGISTRCMHPARDFGQLRLRLIGSAYAGCVSVLCRTPDFFSGLPRPDLVIVACKWRDVPAAFEISQKIWKGDLPPILMPQNGIVQDEVGVLEGLTIFPLVSYVSVESLGIGVARASAFTSLLTTRSLLSRLVPGAERLLGCGVLRLLPSDELTVEQFSKLVLASTGAVMALRNVTIGEALLSGVRHEMAAVAHESSAVVDACLCDRKVGPLVARKVRDLVAALSTGKVPSCKQHSLLSARTSLHMDLVRGQKSEVEQINGWVVRTAKALGIRAPLNEMILREIQSLERTHVRPEIAGSSVQIQSRISTTFEQFRKGVPCE